MKDKNKVRKIKFCQSFVKRNGYFKNMMDKVHIDKKWFYITEENQSYYMLLDETPPYRQTKSKRFITKVMFLAAVT